MPSKKKESVKEVPVAFVRRFKLTAKVCPVCGEKFMGTKVAVYDKLACRQKANYARHREEYSSSNREKYHREKQSVGKK